MTPNEQAIEAVARALWDDLESLMEPERNAVFGEAAALVAQITPLLTGPLQAKLDAAEASIVQWRADERETGEAYMRLRNIIGREAFRTPPGASHFTVTEAALTAALAARNVTATITFDKTDIAEMLIAAAIRTGAKT